MSNISLRQIDVPQMDTGAPCPIVVADESTLVFGYFESSQGPVENSVVIRADGYSIFKLGAPNDEALHGNRYYEAGLEHYGAYEVSNSEWIEELKNANRVHSSHRDSMFNSHRHFIFAFHDSTLEFVTSGKEPEVISVDARHSARLLAQYLRD